MISAALRDEFTALLHAHVPGLHLNGVQVTGRVPWRDDEHPSFSADLNKGAWFDHAKKEGGSVKEFKERLGLNGTPHHSRKIVAIYDYKDEAGTLLFQVVRYEPKAFAQRRPDGKGGWVYNLNDTKRVLYRLSELLKAQTVFIVEGEKDVDRLWLLGLPATTNAGGAGKWRDEYNQYLADKRVVILPDNDEPGEHHAQQVARSLLPVAAAIKIVRLPGLPLKGDVSDWLDAGHTKEELAESVRATPVLRAENLAPQRSSERNIAVITRLSDVTPSRVRWLWLGRIPLGKLTILDGDPGLGKSLISDDIGARTSTGRPMPDGTPSDLSGPAGVVILSAEDDLSDTIRPRLEATVADLSRIVALTAVHTEDGPRMPTLADLAAIQQAITQVNAKLIIVDPVMAYLPGKIDSHRDQDVRRLLAPLAALAAETGVAVLVVRHLNKTSISNPLYRGGGSIGIIGAARSGLLVAKDPDDTEGERRILACTKSNLAQLPPALAYRIETTSADVPVIVWEGVTRHTAASLLTQPEDSDDRSALKEAKGFLSDLLRTGPVPAKEVQRQADHAGISITTLRRAKTALKIIPLKQGGFFSKDRESQQWYWLLSATEDAQDPAEGAQTSENEHLQQSSEKNTRKFNIVAEDAQEPGFEHLQAANEHLQLWEEEL